MSPDQIAAMVITLPIALAVSVAVNVALWVSRNRWRKRALGPLRVPYPVDPAPYIPESSNESTAHPRIQWPPADTPPSRQRP